MLSEVWFMCKLRVRYQETDQMGVVYHANYLSWFELGRTEFIRELGYPYKEMERKGLLLPLTDAELHFKQPARYDDLIHIYVRTVKFSAIRLEFEVQVRRAPEDQGDPSEKGMMHVDALPQGELLVSGTTKHVWINDKWKPVRLDKEAPDIYRLLQNL
jgi:acyl-CoA thioester hydrolase